MMLPVNLSLPVFTVLAHLQNLADLAERWQSTANDVLFWKNSTVRRKIDLDG